MAPWWNVSILGCLFSLGLLPIQLGEYKLYVRCKETASDDFGDFSTPAENATADPEAATFDDVEVDQS